MKKIIGILIVTSLVGCALEPEVGELVRYMVVQTEYNQEEVNDTQNIFNTYATFVLKKDTVGYVYALSEDTILVDDGVNSIDFVTPLINEAESNLISRGFTRGDENASPDFAVNIVVLRDFSFFQTVSYPGYYSGYYGYYGYYYPVVNNYYSNYATLVIEVVDIKNSNNNQFKVIWKAYIGDLLTTADLKLKTLEAINKAFEQSPYFSKTETL